MQQSRCQEGDLSINHNIHFCHFCLGPVTRRDAAGGTTAWGIHSEKSIQSVPCPRHLYRERHAINAVRWASISGKGIQAKSCPGHPYMGKAYTQCGGLSIHVCAMTYNQFIALGIRIWGMFFSIMY